MNARKQTLSLVLGGASLAVGVVIAWRYPEPTRSIVLCIAGVAVFLCGRHFGLSRASTNSVEPDSRIPGLEELGISGVYSTTTAEIGQVNQRIGDARQIRVLAATAEMLFRNVRAALVKAIAQGCCVTVLLATAKSELVRDLDQMEIAAGRPPDARPVHKGITEARHLLLDFLREAATQLPGDQRHRLGQIFVGHFRTQFRGSMLLCDDDWVRWTPHFPPARGDQRPSFLAEGESSRLRQLCDRHFTAVKQVSNPSELGLDDKEASGDAPMPDDATDA